jgi:hypothetical protein
MPIWKSEIKILRHMVRHITKIGLGLLQTLRMYVA